MATPCQAGTASGRGDWPRQHGPRINRVLVLQVSNDGQGHYWPARPGPPKPVPGARQRLGVTGQGGRVRPEAEPHRKALAVTAQ